MLHIDLKIKTYIQSPFCTFNCYNEIILIFYFPKLFLFNEQIDCFNFEIEFDSVAGGHHCGGTWMVRQNDVVA